MNSFSFRTFSNNTYHASLRLSDRGNKLDGKSYGNCFYWIFRNKNAVCLPVYLPVCLSICMYVFLSDFLSACLSVWLTFFSSLSVSFSRYLSISFFAPYFTLYLPFLCSLPLSTHFLAESYSYSMWLLFDLISNLASASMFILFHFVTVPSIQDTLHITTNIITFDFYHNCDFMHSLIYVGVSFRNFQYLNYFIFSISLYNIKFISSKKYFALFCFIFLFYFILFYFILFYLLPYRCYGNVQKSCIGVTKI